MFATSFQRSCLSLQVTGFKCFGLTLFPVVCISGIAINFFYCFFFFVFFCTTGHLLHNNDKYKLLSSFKFQALKLNNHFVTNVPFWLWNFKEQAVTLKEHFCWFWVTWSSEYIASWKTNSRRHISFLLVDSFVKEGEVECKPETVLKENASNWNKWINK